MTKPPTTAEWQGKCRHGHIYSPENIYVTPDGLKKCRACRGNAEKKFAKTNARRIALRKSSAITRSKPGYKDYRKGAELKYRIANPLKMLARRRLQQAVYKGNVLRPDACENCSNQCKPQAHHADYNKALEVRWLCINCHELEHHGVAL